jgi:hypothetical protein
MRPRLDRARLTAGALLVAWVLVDLLTVVVLAALPGLFFWRILSGNPADIATFPLGDFTELHFPYRHWAAEELARGRIPAWNSFLSAGHPSLGDIQFGLLYPLWRWWVGITGQDLTVLQLEQFVVLHVSIAAVGTYLFARTTGTGRLGGIVAALVFAFSGYMTSFPVQQMIILQTSVWLPWLLLGLELTIRWREPLFGLLVAAATAMAALVGHPQTLGYVVLTGAVYGLYRLAVQPSVRGLLGAAFGGLLGLAAAAPALLTALEHLKLTARTDVGYRFTASGFVPHEMIGLILPSDLGGRALYVGLPVLALAGVALTARARQSGFWASVLGVGLVISLGGNSFLYPALYALVPGLQFFRDHERAALVTSLAIALLAGHGLRALGPAARLGDPAKVRTLARAVLAVAGLLGAFGLYLQYAVMTAQGDLRNQLGAVADRAFLTTLFAALAVGLLWASWRGVGRAGGIALAAVLLCGVDLFTTGWTLNVAPGSPDKLLQSRPAVEFLRQSSGPLDRIASEGVLPADGNMGALFRLADIVGNSPLDLEAYRVFSDKVDEFQRWRLLNVRFIVTKRKIEDPRLPKVFQENDLNLHEVRRDLRLPRAWLVHRAVVAGDRDDELDLTRRIKVDEEVVLASAVGALDGRPPDRPVGEGTDVAVTDYDPERISLATWSSRDAVMVLSERDYPGWSATIDGQAAPLVRADYVLRGLYVPAGRHQVELRFDPPGFALGQRLATQAGIAAVVLILLRIVLEALLWSGRRVGGILAKRSARRRSLEIAATSREADHPEADLPGTNGASTAEEPGRTSGAR